MADPWLNLIHPWRIAPPKGRKFAIILISENNLEVAQWDPKFNCWAVRGGYSYRTEDIQCWCAVPKNNLLNEKIVEVR